MAVLNPTYLWGFHVSTRSTDSIGGTNLDTQMLHTYGDLQLVPGVLRVLTGLNLDHLIGKSQSYWFVSSHSAAFLCRTEMN